MSFQMADPTIPMISMPSAGDQDRLSNSIVATAPPSGPLDEDGSDDGIWTRDIDMSIGKFGQSRGIYQTWAPQVCTLYVPMFSPP